MMIKFTMSSGGSFTLSKEQAEKVLDSRSQLVRIADEKGEWTGKTINQAHIISTSVDQDATNEKVKPNFKLPQLKGEDEKDRVTHINKTLDEKREELKKKGIIR